MNDLVLAKKYLRNQVVKGEIKYHFETTGIIHEFGFGPVYKSNLDTKHSIDKFAKSEFYQRNLFLNILKYFLRVTNIKLCFFLRTVLQDRSR